MAPGAGKDSGAEVEDSVEYVRRPGDDTAAVLSFDAQQKKAAENRASRSRL